MKLIAKTFVCAAALVTAAAQAEGLYLGGSIGNSRYKGPDVGGLSTDRSDTGGKLYGGWGITPNIAVELGWADLGKAESAAGSVRSRGAFADLVGTVPVYGSLSALGRVGVFNGKTELAGTSETKTKAKYGLGLQYDFNKQTGIRSEWERYRLEAAGTKADTDLWSVGLNYRF